MNLDRFTIKSQEAIAAAGSLAERRRNPQVLPEHLLLVLLEQEGGAVAPVLTYPHSRGRCAITGGYVVRDPRLTALDGWYVYGDFCTGRLRAALLRAWSWAPHAT